MFWDQGSRMASAKVDISVKDDETLQDRRGEKDAGRNVHIKAGQLQTRGGVLPNSIAGRQGGSLMAAKEKLIWG